VRAGDTEEMAVGLYGVREVEVEVNVEDEAVVCC